MSMTAAQRVAHLPSLLLFANLVATAATTTNRAVPLNMQQALNYYPDAFAALDTSVPMLGTDTDTIDDKLETALPASTVIDNVPALPTVTTLTVTGSSFADAAAAYTWATAFRTSVGTEIGNIRTTIAAMLTAMKEHGLMAPDA